MALTLAAVRACAGEHGADVCGCGGCGGTETFHTLLSCGHHECEVAAGGGHTQLLCGHYACQIEPYSDHSLCGGYRCDGKSHEGLGCDHCQQVEGDHSQCTLCGAFLCDGDMHGEGVYII